jgi:hypothetical protein
MKAIKDAGYTPVKLLDGRWAGVQYLKESKQWYGAVLNSVDSEGKVWWEDHCTATTRRRLIEKWTHNK